MADHEDDTKSSDEAQPEPKPGQSVTVTNSSLIASPVASPGASVKTGDITIGAQEPVLQQLARLREAVRVASLDAETREEAVQNIDALQQEHGKEKPNRTVVDACWSWLARTLPDVLASAGKTAIEAWVKAHIGP